MPFRIQNSGLPRPWRLNWGRRWLAAGGRLAARPEVGMPSEVPAGSPASPESDSVKGRSWADVADEVAAEEARRAEMEERCSTPSRPTLADYMATARRVPRTRKTRSPPSQATAAVGLRRRVGSPVWTGFLPRGEGAGGDRGCARTSERRSEGLLSLVLTPAPSPTVTAAAPMPSSPLPQELDPPLAGISGLGPNPSLFGPPRPVLA